MAKMTRNPDGTVTIPLTNDRVVVLPEPSAEQLADMREMMVKADAELPTVPPMSSLTRPTDSAGAERYVAELKLVNETVDDRNAIIYGHDSPHGKVILEIIRMLTNESYGLADVFGWAMTPETCRLVREHWQSPLPGVE